jgi:glycolate oxidase
VLPRASYSAFAYFINKLGKESGLSLPVFGHLGDGNLHVNVIYNEGDSRQKRIAENTVHRLMTKVVDLGGAISGEHGIGLSKSTFLNLEHSPAEIAAMKAVKKALDPRGILNPGKMFAPFDMSQALRVTTPMLWDTV